MIIGRFYLERGEAKNKPISLTNRNEMYPAPSARHGYEKPKIAFRCHFSLVEKVARAFKQELLLALN